jgi:hypothetical protein
MAAGYYNFMENTLGLGKNGTHLAHAGVAGGATWAAGKYANIDVIANNWWAPFAGAFAGLGLSLTARALLVDDEVQVDLVMKSIKKDLKGRKLTDKQKGEMEVLIAEFTSASAAAEVAANQESRANKLGDLRQTG